MEKQALGGLEQWIVSYIDGIIKEHSFVFSPYTDYFYTYCCVVMFLIIVLILDFGCRKTLDDVTYINRNTSKFLNPVVLELFEDCI